MQSAFNQSRSTRRRGQPREPSISMLLLAALCLTAGIVLVAQGYRFGAAAATLAAAVPLTIELVLMGWWDQRTNASVIARLFAQAQSGRRLAIYDRETGLFAHWYMALRGQEECARAARYDRKVSLLVVEPPAGDPASAWSLRSDIGRWIQTELRATDIAGYVGNGRFVVLAPEADMRGTQSLVVRIREKVARIEVGVASFPDDGVTYDQLWRLALSRLRDGEDRVAA